MSGRRAAHLLLLALIAAGIGAGEVGGAPDEPQIQKWIAQLDAAEWKDRAEAQERLVQAGRRALPLVEAAIRRGGMSADAMMTLHDVANACRQQNILQPTPVQLERRYESAVQAWEALARQAGLQFAPPAGEIVDWVKAKPATLDEAATTWARARHQLEKQHAVQAVVHGEQLTLAKPSRAHVREPEDWSTAVVASVGKPSLSGYGREFGAREVVIPITFDLDPSLRFMFNGPMFSATEMVVVQGEKPLMIGEIGSSHASYQRAGRCRILGTLRVMVPHSLEDVTKVARMRVELAGRAVKTWQTFEAVVAEGQHQVVGEGRHAMGVTFVPRPANAGGGWDMRIADVKNATPTSQQIMEWHLGHAYDLQVLDAAGERMPLKVDRVQRPPGEGHVKLTESDSLILSIPSRQADHQRPPALVRWVVPVDVGNVSYPFDLTDFEIPATPAKVPSATGPATRTTVR